MTHVYPVSNYYEATAQRQDYPVLQGDMVADICVIGGGIAGCSTALDLAQRGYRVVLLESHRIGHGASGRNGGQLLPGYSCGQQTLKSLVGGALAHQLWDISVEAVASAISLIKQHHIECDLKFGHIDAAIKPRHRDELLRQRDLLQGEYGYQGLHMMESDQLQSHIHSEKYMAGLLDPSAAHIHPLRYTLGLARAAQSFGATLYEDSAAISVEHKETDVRVTTERGSINATHVVLCANVGNTALNQRSPGIMPVATHVIATEQLDSQCIKKLMDPDLSVTDCNFIVDYFRISQSRLLFGGGVTYSGNTSASDLHLVHKHMLKVFPQLSSAKIEHAWHGLIDISMNRAPDFGRIENNIYYLQGFSGHGLALATIAGKLVAESITVQSERFDLFGHIPHRSFPGGSLRTPLLMLAMLWYRLRDLL